MAIVDLTPAETQKLVFRNADRPFTELFSLLDATGEVFRKCDDTTLEAIKQHTSTPWILWRTAYRASAS